jgi:hypothetical protein
VVRVVVLFDETVKVTLPDPGSSTLDGLRDTTSPEGEEAVKVTFTMKLLELVKITVYCRDAPAGKLWEV